MADNTNFLVVVSVFKNEGHIIREWVEHYVAEGVDHFVLIDNGSTDNYAQGLTCPGKITLDVDPQRYNQVGLLNKHLELLKTYEWVLVVDLDEFMYGKKGFTIRSYLESIPKTIHQVVVPWKMFGSSGHQSQPTNVVKGFTQRKHYADKRMANFKAVCRTRHLRSIGVHQSHFKYDGLETITPDNTSVDMPSLRSSATLIDENVLRSHSLALNHYAIQSWEYFSGVKMTRGGNNRQTEHLRDEHYFHSYDWNDMCDTELLQKKSTG
jgi:hypothetical protein